MDYDYDAELRKLHALAAKLAEADALACTIEAPNTLDVSLRRVRAEVRVRVEDLAWRRARERSAANKALPHWSARSPFNLEYHHDGGHGWIKVPKNLLFVLGIAGAISGYSYADDAYAYLEEDCDANRFMEAAKARDWVITLTDVDDGANSPIRALRKYGG